ncbi:MAG: twin-arginine translocase subunit TatC, partial [Candidatus Krumholzibacteria bacterium]|nr:twin-arginine translocase subunit TatC [Candidatus Krumholzibacteria bacterium]
ALFLGLPFIFYQIWAFIAPGLFLPEKRRIFPVFLSSVVLFYLGSYFAYTVIIPIMMNYFFGLSPEGTEMTVGISQLFSVVSRL